MHCPTNHNTVMEHLGRTNQSQSKRSNVNWRHFQRIREGCHSLNNQQKLRLQGEKRDTRRGVPHKKESIKSFGSTASSQSPFLKKLRKPMPQQLAFVYKAPCCCQSTVQYWLYCLMGKVRTGTFAHLTHRSQFLPLVQLFPTHTRYQFSTTYPGGVIQFKS